MMPSLVEKKNARIVVTVGINAMAGGQVTYGFGFCPYNYRPYCCAAIVGH